MNVLFLTMSRFVALYNHGIYEDLMREFVHNGHKVFVVSPTEKRDGGNTHIVESDDRFVLLRIKTGNLQKTSFIKKGIATLQVSKQFKKGIKKHLPSVKFDLILYSTPPITLYDTIKYLKKRDKAKTLLLLKDIFPQNAIDIGVLKKSGLKGIIYRYFRKKEKKLYAVSDYIGCMSKANVNYLLLNNPELDTTKIAIVPNSIELQDISLNSDDRIAMRNKYGIPQDKIVFVYGGNLGKPQNVPFIIDCLKSQLDNEKVFFLIVGDGTEYHLFEEFASGDNLCNVKVMKRLPRDDFDMMLAACDVGMIFLDDRFTIPNYPSRLLSYMQAGIPVIACTDANTDVGRDIVDGGFGWWCESNNTEKFAELIQEICACERNAMGEAAKEYLREHFNVADVYSKIMDMIGANE